MSQAVDDSLSLFALLLVTIKKYHLVVNWQAALGESDSKKKKDFLDELLNGQEDMQR